MTVFLHSHDLPDDIKFDGSVAVDSETLGLRVHRDKLCLVQLSAGDGHAHIVQLDRISYQAPNLKNLLTDTTIEKIFHFARFDVAVFQHYLQVQTTPVFCTKIASKLIRTYTDRHGLKDVVQEVTGIELSKKQQSSDWGADTLSKAQIAYAASDVLHLHKIREALVEKLEREDRRALATACFEFLPHRSMLDLAGWEDVDIFAHS